MTDTSASNRQFATSVVETLRSQGHHALFAGGCVRDLLLGRPASDYDVATTATPDQVREVFGKRKTLPVGASFGVIIVLGPTGIEPVEVATFRTEGPYEDGRRPSRVAYCTPREDAQRRDFTINGMFYDPIDSRVEDYVGGEADLAARVVRAIGNPHDRMNEDKLRMLRAVRFTANLDFALDGETAAAIRLFAHQIQLVSAERIAAELRKMMVNVHRRRAVELVVDLKLSHEILPELPTHGSEWTRTLELLECLANPTWELAFSGLVHALPGKQVLEICRRLKLSNDETERIVWLVTHQNSLLSADQLTLAELKRLLVHPGSTELLRLMHASLLSRRADLHPVLFCEEYLRRTPREVLDPPPLITGDHLISLGMKPGPQFRDLLEVIRARQLNCEMATHDEAVAFVQQYQDAAKTPSSKKDK